MTEKESKKSSRGGKREGAGRPKGVPNKMSTTVKENVLAVFEQLGGVQHMAEWAVENPNQFYNLYAKLLPTDTNVSHTGSVDFRNIIVNGVTPK